MQLTVCRSQSIICVLQHDTPSPPSPHANYKLQTVSRHDKRAQENLHRPFWRAMHGHRSIRDSIEEETNDRHHDDDDVDW